MDLPPDSPRVAHSLSKPHAPWFQRLSRPILFLIVTLMLVGACLAFTIPVAVFPNTDFPRIVMGIDNGVMPIDQMLVVITRPVEEAVNSVPGLQKVQSITSRGSAEVDLFFDWPSDMILTLQRVDAVVARLQSELPPTAKIETHRLTFATFPILGYSLTSDTIPQNKLWEIATYDLKPRVNRLDGVASVLIQGGRVPEFQVMPEPARLLAAGITVNDILDAIRRTNLIDSPGLIENNHQLVLGLISGQVRTPEQLVQIVVKTSTAGVPIRLGDIANIAPSVAPVYTMVTANGKPAVLLSVHRQPDSNTLDVANEVHAQIEEIRPTLPPGVRIEPFYDQSTIVHESIASVRDAVLLGLLLSSIILVLFLRDWGTSLVAGLVIPATLLITFIVLRLTGQSFNLMTRGGLAAALLAAEEAHLSGFFGRVIAFYARAMEAVLKRPFLLAGSSVLIVILAFVCYKALGSDLLPEMDEGGFILDYWTPPGSSLAESDRILQHIEEIVRSQPEVENTSRRTGLQLGLAAVTEANRGDFTVKLKRDRKRGIDEVISDVRSEIEQTEPAAKVEFVQVLQDMIGDLTSQPEPIVIKLFSQDSKLLANTAPRVADAIQRVHGVVDVLDGIENTISGPATTFQINPAVAARAGFTPEEVAVDASAILEGEPAATPVVVNDRAYTIRVRFPEQGRSTLDRMSNTLLTSATGRTATLGSLATVS